MKVYVVTDVDKAGHDTNGAFEAVYSTYEKAKESYPDSDEIQSQYTIDCIEVDTNRYIDEATTEMFLDKAIRDILIGHKGVVSLWDGKLKNLHEHQGLKVLTQDTDGSERWFPAIYLSRDSDGDYVLEIFDIENIEPFYIYDAFGKEAFSKKYQRIKSVLCKKAGE